MKVYHTVQTVLLAAASVGALALGACRQADQYPAPPAPATTTAPAATAPATEAATAATTEAAATATAPAK